MCTITEYTNDIPPELFALIPGEGVMVKVPASGVEIREFDLQLRYYADLQNNTLLNSLIPPKLESFFDKYDFSIKKPTEVDITLNKATKLVPSNLFFPEFQLATQSFEQRYIFKMHK